MTTTNTSPAHRINQYQLRLDIGSMWHTIRCLEDAANQTIQDAYNSNFTPELLLETEFLIHKLKGRVLSGIVLSDTLAQSDEPGNYSWYDDGNCNT